MHAQSLRFAFRQLRKALGFTLTVILTLALGIGATTAIFSLVEGILLRPLPFKDADRLVILGGHLGGGPNISVTAREISNYSKRTLAFKSMGSCITTSYEVSGGPQPEQIDATRVTASTFPTLGIEPIIGRVFTAQEEDTNQPVAVISYSLWLNRYSRDTRVLNSTIVLDRRSYSIIGVMPRSFEFPLQDGRLNQTKIWVPMSLTADELSDDYAGFWGYHMIARLGDGVSLSQAAADADRVAHQTMQEFPAEMSAIHIQGDVKLLRQFVVADVRPILRNLFFAVSVVLLIACANVSGLLLVRAIRRRREFAVRLAVGAGSSVIIRDSMLEGLLLGISGGSLGLAFAGIVLRTSPHWLPESMPRVSAISMNATVAIFGLCLAIGTGALCGLAPAFAALRTNLSESLKEGTRNRGGSSNHTWLRSILVISEIAVALLLLTISGAFLRSLQKMRAIDPGFRTDHVLAAGYQLPLSQYSTDATVDTFNKAIVDRLSNKPGVIAVGLISTLPASGSSAASTYTIEGQPVDGWKLKFAVFANVYGDYFRAMSIPLLDGRSFTNYDNSTAPLVVIVNHSMAEHCWPGQQAIGKRMHVGNPNQRLPWATIVGIVADTKIGSRDEPSRDQWYYSAQQPAILYGSEASGKLTRPAGGYIALRSALPPRHMEQTLRSTIGEIDSLLALQQVQPMDEAVSDVEAPRRFNTDLITAFAAASLLLAITGIYAVVAFSTSLRNQEIAIRMALGAQRSGIARMVLISGAKLTLAGCALGVLGALATSRVVSAFLFDVSAKDPFVFLGAVLIMMFMALVASALPAIRAASADPIKSLRST